MLSIAVDTFLKNDIQAHVLSTGIEVGQYADILHKNGYKIQHIPFEKSPLYFWNLHKFLKKERYEVVHIHPERGFFWHALIAKLAGANKIFRTYHNVFLFSGFLRIRKKSERWLAVHLLGVKNISIGPSVQKVESTLFNNKSYLIPNWTDDQKFYPAIEEERRELRSKYGLFDSDIVLVSVGSCSPVKNHAAIINSLEKVFEKNPNVVYLHAGEGDLLQSEKELANQKGVLNFTRFLGNTNQVREILAMSDIFIMPSLYEGFSISALEASFCGLPIIAYDVYGLRDIVINNVNGFLIDPNQERLADAIIELSTNYDLRKRMGNQARNLATKNYSMKNSIDLLLALYKGKMLKDV
jgi:glycosyltransferase involved in cell wall biosynthesis